MTDQRAQFETMLVNSISKKLQMRLLFTPTYWSWTDEIVEGLSGEILRIALALISKWRFAEKEWPAISEPIQKFARKSPAEGLSKNTGGKLRCRMECLVV